MATDVSLDAATVVSIVAAVIALGSALAAALAAKYQRRAASAAEIQASAAKTQASAADIQAQLLASQSRPILVEVLPAGPPPNDIGAQLVDPDTQDWRYQLRSPTAKIDEYVDPRRVIVLWPRANRMFISLPLRNVGVGVARIDDAPRVKGEGLGEVCFARARRKRVPTGETTYVEFFVAYHGKRPRKITVEVPYADFRGSQTEIASVTAKEFDSGWFVVGIDYTARTPNRVAAQAPASSLGQEQTDRM